MIDPTDSPAKAHLREVVQRIKTSRQTYSNMTLKQLLFLRSNARAWLEEHPDNIDGLKRYDKLCDEIERRNLD